MFAFAIHERDSGRVVLGRDRFGIKPLYLAETAAPALRLVAARALATGGSTPTIDRSLAQFYMSFHAVVPAPTRSSRACASCRRRRSA
jgi:asparagine synthase (glutamine-hydrolysing)